MSRPALLAFAAAAALAASGCAKSACQEFGEKLCSCQPGMTEDTCKTQVQDQLNNLGVDTAGFSGMLDRMAAGSQGTFEDYCQDRLDACVGGAEAAQADFCEWLLTETGKNECGLTPEHPYPPLPP